MSTPAATDSDHTERQHRYRILRRVTLVGSIVDLGLGIAKILVGAAVRSQALIADGIHSLSDLATDVLVIWAGRHASQGPDDEHPYGHQRIETMASVALGLILVLVAGGIAYDALIGWLRGEIAPAPGAWALTVAIASGVSKEALYHYTAHAARKVQSDLLLGNAWHSRTDAWSSVVVIVGLVGSMNGYPWLDAVAAVVVAGMITWIGWTIVRSGARELVDTAVDSDKTLELRGAAVDVEGVRDIHDLRTRRMGSDIFLDGHVLLADPTISVSEGHRIADAVRERLHRKFRNMHDITIHVDVEDDRRQRDTSRLPLRTEVIESLRHGWKDIHAAEAIDKVVLHYLDGGIRAEVWLSLEAFEDIEQAREAAASLRETVPADARIDKVEIGFL